MKFRCGRSILNWAGILAFALQAVCAVSFAQLPVIDGPARDPTLLPLTTVPSYSGNSELRLDEGTTYVDGLPDAPVTFGPGGFGHSCCGDCPPGWHARVDGLLLNREIREYTSSNVLTFDDLGYEQGARLSLIRRLDCLDAWEITYVGPYQWEEVGQLAGVGLTSQLTSTTLDLSEFNNATLHAQRLRSTLNSLEVNRRWFGWDVISTFAGVRYLHIGEDYLFNSTGTMGLGELTTETNNHLLGAQLGMELMYPVGRWSTTASVKGGLFGNVIDGSASLTNNGVGQFSNAAEDFGFAAAVEVGYFASFQVTPRIKFRAGYEFWWLYGVALATDQVTSPLTANTGRAVDDATTVYHGATAGVEIDW